jgi:hypothetical protein
MEFEDELTELFDHATATLRPPVEELLEQSSARGRRMQRRRRTAKAALGTFGITAVVCGTAVGVLHGYSPARAATGDGMGSASPKASPATPALSAPPSASPTTRATAQPSPGTPSQTSSMAATATTTTGASQTSAAHGGTNYDLLQSLLPAGANLQPMPYDWGGTVPGAADALYNDGHGTVMLSVSATSAQVMTSCTGWLGGTNEGKRPVGATPVSCTSETMPDGDIETEVVTGVDANGYYDYEVTLARTDGTNVMAVVGNGIPEGATVDVTRAVPPLTLAQLQVLAADPGWQPN